MGEEWKGPLRKVDEWRWLIPRDYKKGMRTDGLIYASERMIRDIRKDQAPEQVANVACLPGIVGKSLAMPDIHWGYGFPIGGVAATRVEDGVISPGGVGFDINCGVRMLVTSLEEKEVRPVLDRLLRVLFRNIPSGVGSEGRISFSVSELRKVMEQGAQYIVKRGWGLPEDTECTEEQGAMPGANPDKVSQKAIERGKDQLGSLGSGNHFLEIEVVETVFRPDVAEMFGLFKSQVVVMIHTGSRGFGHQICTDSLNVMQSAMRKYGISLPDRQLACAPFNSEEGKAYFESMVCAANFAWANRQLITHWVRESFEEVFGKSAQELGIRVLYDVAHNIAKLEEHEVEGEKAKVVVHRKGATRAFGPEHPVLPQRYRNIGQPVLIPGDMGTGSFVLVGTERAMQETFGSTCHGAGRMMSRSEADRRSRGRDIAQEMEAKGVLVLAESKATLREEIPEAYKDVSQVVEVVDRAGLSRKVVYARPLGVIKG
ncbi:RtcB family protein [Thermatribacter velox]|uniref:tRNA-splicing ligase RtcB n=1 Tax=Thermatribacter velox TaxID=3039681 RepID=A0ABZ2YC55_9BACT